MLRVLLIALCAILPGAQAEDLPLAAQIGRALFLDTGLSHPPGQGCISCHDPQHAFADPRRVSPGAVEGRAGTRNAPSLMYASLTPSLHHDDVLTEEGEEIKVWEGGLFHDGRAVDLFAQVQQPFFDPNELNIADTAALARGLRSAKYADRLRAWVGAAAWENDDTLTFYAFRALVEFLKEPMFRPFDARIDSYLEGDKKALSEAEKRGLKVFNDAGCESCHLLVPSNWPKPLLSDFGFDNLGAPSRGKRDPGLAAHSGSAHDIGKFRSPSLRNVALTAPYMHNGSIATLREVLEFYNKRNLESDRWGATDYPDTVNQEDLGDLKLSDAQIDDLLALMDAFTDRTLLDMPKGSSFPKAPDDAPPTAKVYRFFPDWSHRDHPAYPGRDLPPE